jgi:CDGSH-type Zn-finger protein
MRVEILKDGPILLHSGDRATFKSGASTEEKSGPVALCRCGGSATKPFCDGKHRDRRFEAEACEIEVAD